MPTDPTTTEVLPRIRNVCLMLNDYANHGIAIPPSDARLLADLLGVASDWAPDPGRMALVSGPRVR